MKIKYLSGKKLNEVVDVEDIKAKSLIEDGLAEEVAADPLDVAVKNLEAKINEMAQKAADNATKMSVEKLNKGLSRASEITVGPDRESLDPSGGFKSSSHFYTEVATAGRSKEMPETLKRWNDLSRKSTGGNETTAADGGFAVPTTYESELLRISSEQPNFREKALQVPMQTAFTKIPVVKNYDRSNTTVTANIVAAEVSEGSAITPSKLQWEQISLTLGKEAIIVPVTNELLEDNNVAIGGVVNYHAAYQLNKRCNGGIIRGVSSAFTGIINHAATVTVAPTTHNTVTFTDVLAMFAAYSHDDDSYSAAEWFCHPTALPAIGAMTVTSTGQAIYFPPGGAMNTPGVGSLLGRPLNVTGWCNPLISGSAGSLLLVNMKKYVLGFKDGVKSMMSPHVYFTTDEMAFRFTLRITGKPGLTGPITLEDGSAQVSPFVQLGYHAG